MQGKSIAMAAMTAVLLGPAIGAAPVSAQTGAAAPQLAQTGEMPAYKPPMRGAPGGRIGGASRGSAGAALPTIEPVSPDAHSGLTTSPSPTLYYYISQPVSLPVKLTISAPNQARPLVETNLPPVRGAGLQALRLSDYRVQLQPNIPYTWSVSVVVDPRSPSNDVVASATVTRVALDPAVENAARAATPLHRAVVYAQAGIFYDAVAAAAEGAQMDRHAALDALLDQVGLREAAAYDRRVGQGG